MVVRLLLILLLIMGWKGFHSEVSHEENIYDRIQNLEWPYRRWEHTGITKQMVDCAARHLLEHPRQFLTPVILKVTNGGKDVSISYYKNEHDHVEFPAKDGHRMLLSEKGDNQESNQRRGRVVIPIHMKRDKHGKVVVIDPTEDFQKMGGNDPNKIKGMNGRLQSWLKSKGISTTKRVKVEPKQIEPKPSETDHKKREPEPLPSPPPPTEKREEKVSTKTTNKSIVKTMKKKIDSAPSRMIAMESGVRQAIAYARKYLGIRRFPDIYALMVVTDADGILERRNDTCRDAEGNKHLWPPIFSQNLRFHPDNLFVMLPDFSFFSSFEHGEDHGNKDDDVWFTVLDKETKKDSAFGSIPYDQKNPNAVYRGKMSATARKWGPLRQALLPELGCKAATIGLLDIGSDPNMKFKSKSEMCHDHQAIITLPGNGAWSWATKFNLLCNSVTMMVSPQEAGGASWETRPSLNLMPMGHKSTTDSGTPGQGQGSHYLALDHRPSHICNDLIDKVNWLRGHPKEAFDMATRARAFTLHHLSRSAVLHDFASLLLGYHLMVSVAATTTTTSTTTTSSTITISESNKPTVMSHTKDKSFTLSPPLSILPVEIKTHLWKQFQKQSELIRSLQISPQPQQQQPQKKKQTKRQTSG